MAYAAHMARRASSHTEARRGFRPSRGPDNVEVDQVMRDAGMLRLASLRPNPNNRKVR